MSKEENLECSFCGRKKAETDLLIAGMDAHICDKCIEQAHGIVEEEISDAKSSTLSKDLMLKKPKEIKSFLDEYIIGQDETKRAMAVAVYNHYKRLLQDKNDEDDVEIEKSNIVLVGETGTGKTLVARTIAKMLNVPFSIVDATTFFTSSLTESEKYSFGKPIFIPLTVGFTLVKSGTSLSELVLSFLSFPQIAFNAIAISST